MKYTPIVIATILAIGQATVLRGASQLQVFDGLAGENKFHAEIVPAQFYLSFLECILMHGWVGGFFLQAELRLQKNKSCM